MALTRTFLKSIGIDSDKIDPIIEAHAETVDGLKAKIAENQTDYDALKTTVSERDQLKIDLEKANKSIASYKDKMTASDAVSQERDQLKGEVDSLKAEIEQFTEREKASNSELNSLQEKVTKFEADWNTATAEAQTAKTELANYKAQVETERANAVKKDILRSTLRNGGVTRTDFQDLIINSTDINGITVEDNAIVDGEQFIESTKSKYPSCFGTVEEGGTPTVEPLGGNPPRTLTLAQIKNMSAEEINKNWAEVQKAMAKGV